VRQAALAATQTAAETSSGNFCREPHSARNPVDQYNGMDWPIRRKVVDIEHLITIKKDTNGGTLVCYGVWVHTNGATIEGTMTMHPNVAGDIIVARKPEHWVPEVSTWVQPQPVTTAPSTSATPANTISAFEQGLADRKTIEAWFSSTIGDYPSGALYWAAQRSLPHPGTCTALGGEQTSGCFAAQARLAGSDSRRKSEPEYRQG
jgi:hypothetical protein